MDRTLRWLLHECHDRPERHGDEGPNVPTLVEDDFCEPRETLIGAVSWSIAPIRNSAPREVVGWVELANLSPGRSPTRGSVFVFVSRWKRMAVMLTIAQLAKQYEESEWTIRRTLLALAASNRLAKGRDYRIEDGGAKFHRVYFVNPDRFFEEATRLHSRLANKLLALKQASASNLQVSASTETAGASSAEIDLRLVKESLTEAKQERNVLADKLAAIRGEAGRWKGAFEVERETRVRADKERNPTLCDVIRLLQDDSFRHRMIARVADPYILGGFWEFFEGLSESQRAAAVGPVMNKLRDVLGRSAIRRLLCQSRSTFDLRHVMDRNGILLCNLDAGSYGDDTAALLGSFVFSRIWQEARRRTAIPENERRDFFLYVDEFQNFLGVAQSFADTLAMARSLRLSLILAHQDLGQLSPEIRSAVLSNARTRIVFQTGQDDARTLAHEMEPLTPRDLLHLPRFHFAARLSASGETSRAFTGVTLPAPDATDPTIAGDTIAESARRYGRPVAEIDREIAGVVAEPEEPKMPPGAIGETAR